MPNINRVVVLLIFRLERLAIFLVLKIGSKIT